MKKVKIITIALAIVAVTMIAFVGIYTQTQNRMENRMKDYSFAMDLKGSRNVRLKVNTSNKTIIKDAEGKVVEEENLTDEQIAEKGYVKEEIPNNVEEVKTLENYKISQAIIEQRLKKIGVSNYNIKLEETTGDILVELPENDTTDQTISNISTVGKFELVDSQTNEILMNNQDIKQVKVMYGAGTEETNSGTAVYLDIEFTKEGAKKLEDISNQYVKIENTDATENETEEQTTTAEKKVSLKIDDAEIMSTSFEKPVRTGKLQLSVGSTATDKKTLQDYVTQASNMATVLDTGNVPVKYDLEENQYILSDITDTTLAIIVYTLLAFVIIGFIVLMIKYKKLGILGVISQVGFISLLMIIVRYTNVVISLEGILGMVFAFLLDYILVNKLLAKANERRQAYKDFFIKMVPIMIMIVTFCFIGWTPISSFGMTMFWGLVLMAIYNVIITNSLLKIGKEEM